MNIQRVIADIETARTTTELRDRLQTIALDLGFCGFNFIDAGSPGSLQPFYIGTAPAQWEIDYKGNSFVLSDPVLSKARRVNVPFSWGTVTIPGWRKGGGRRSIAQKTMEAAREFGFTEGFVIPFHFRDRLGRLRSCCTCFFWTDMLRRFHFLISQERHSLHLIMLYWSQRMIDLIDADRLEEGSSAWHGEQVVLTDRERDVLSWAARGLTGPQAAERLGLSPDSHDWYIRNAMQKLDASTKTHAVSKAIVLGLIDV